MASVFFSYGILLLLYSRFKGRSEDISHLPLELPTVTLLIAARGPAEILQYTLDKVCEMDYPRDKLPIVVAVYERDDEILKVCSSFGSQIRTVIVRGGAGKASALNQALSHVDSEFVLLLDIDSIPDKDALQKMLPLIGNPDVSAVTGVLYPLNEAEGLLPQIFRFDMSTWKGLSVAKDRLGWFVQAAGGDSLLRASSIRSVGGWDESSISEDNDLAVRLWMNGGRIRLAPVNFGVEAPAKFGDFVRQRFRWYRGAMDVYGKYFKDMMKLDFLKKVDLSFTFLAPMFVALVIPLIVASLIQGGFMLVLFLCVVLMQVMGAFMVDSDISAARRAKMMLVVFPYVVLQSLICLAALLSMPLPVKVRWTGTRMSGFHVKERPREG
jgi:cellulose synthase/poly-beta-1,6-N-acetylglucosamine synthase-like glycosyltransferase